MLHRYDSESIYFRKKSVRNFEKKWQNQQHFGVLAGHVLSHDWFSWGFEWRVGVMHIFLSLDGISIKSSSSDNSEGYAHIGHS